MPNEAVATGALQDADTATGDTTVPSAPSSDELARALHEFGKCHAPADPDAVLADARWFEAHVGKPELTRYRGEYVVVYDGAVVRHGRDALQVELDAARALNVHPRRLLVEFIPHSDSAVAAPAPCESESVREQVPQCPPELAELLDALLAPARARPTREHALAVLARAFPPPPQAEKPHLTPEWRARLDDLQWIHDGYATGAWDAYMGSYIGVHRKQLIAFGPDPNELRARVAREHGIAPDELVVEGITRYPFE
jgi:hypothetical protein